MKKGLSLLLAVLLIIGIFPATTLAATEGTWEKVTDASTLKAGDQLVLACESKNVVAGDISSSIMAKIDAKFDSTENTITSLPTNAVVLTLGGSAGAWTLSNDDGKLLGATAAKKVAWGSGTTTWSISIEGGNATIQNGTDTYGRFLYNVSSPRFTTYTSTANTSMLLPQLYRLKSSGPAVEVERNITLIENGITVYNATVAGAYTLPEVTAVPTDYRFVGWVTDQYTDVTDAPEKVYGAGDEYTDADAVTFYALYTYTETVTGGDVVAGFQKVTTAPGEWDGRYLFVYEDGSVAFDGSLEKLDAVSNTVEATISNGKIEATEELNNAVFTIEKSGDNYTIKSASGYYIGQTSDANGLASDKDETHNNTITLDVDGNVNVVSGGAYLRYNSASNQTRFRYYKSSTYTGQKAIALYKEVTGGSAEVTYYTTSVVTESESAWNLNINKVSLRTASTGIYYSAEWALTEEQVEQVKSYGVIVTLDKDVELTIGAESGCMWTSLDMAELEDGEAEGTGVLISGIMKEGKNNAERAAMQIRAAAYVKLTDGEVIVSEEKAYSLQELVEALDAKITDETTYTEQLKSFYKNWEDAMTGWDLENINN